MVGGVGRGLGEDLASQRDPPVEILLADRVEGLDQRDFIEGDPLVAKHVGHAVDLVESVSLVEQSHQPASERRLNIPQLDRTQVIVDGLVGGTGNSASSPFRLGPAHQSGRRSEISAASRRASPRSWEDPTANLVKEEDCLRESPEGPFVAFDLADLAHEIAGSVLVTGLDGQVEQLSRTWRFSGWRDASSRQCCRARAGLAEPDLGQGEPIEKRGPVGGRDLLPGLRQLGHRGLGRASPSRPQ